MIGKHSRGWDAGGLLRYLMGPGRANEHVGQRVVGAWTGDPGSLQPAVKDPATLVSGKACGFDVRELAAQLTAAARYGQVSMVRPEPDGHGRAPAGLVWHCSLRNHESDRVLTDAEWAQVAADVMHRTGIATHGDPGGCRWVAIRHADDHVHIAAVLVRQDTGRKVHPRRDWPATMAACHAAEARYGLTSTAPADRTALGKPSRAEVEKAARRTADPASRDRSAETARTWLARMVAEAAVASWDVDSLTAELWERQVLVQTRTHPGGEGVVFGMPGDRTAAGEQVWFAGSTLAPDLSLPKLRARWAATPGEPPQRRRRGELAPRADREAAELAALDAIDQATATLGQAVAELRAAGPGAPPDPETADQVAGIIHAAGDMTCVIGELIQDWWHLSRWSANYVDRPGGQIPAYVFGRATRQPGVGQPRHWDHIAAQLRGAARVLAHVRPDGAVLVLALLELIAEVMAWHTQTRHLAQAGAARSTAELLTQASSRPGGHPDQVAAPSRAREDSRRPGHSGDSIDRQAARQDARQRRREQKLASLRRRITEQVMSRRPEAGHTDAELAALITQAHHAATTAQARVGRLRAELAHLQAQIGAGQGPAMRELHTQLGRLRECVRLHQGADDQHDQQTRSQAHAEALRAQAFALHTQANAGGMRWPGQRARLDQEAAQLTDQARAVDMAAIRHGWEADRLRGAAAEHGPAQAHQAYAGLRALETDWAPRAAGAQAHDAGLRAQLRAELRRADTDAVTAADTAARLEGERRYRDTQPAHQRRAEDEVRTTRHATAPGATTPRKTPRPATGRAPEYPPPLRRPPPLGPAPGRRR